MTANNDNNNQIGYFEGEMVGNGGRGAGIGGKRTTNVTANTVETAERPLVSDAPHNPPEFSGSGSRRLAGRANQNWGTGFGSLDCGHPIQWLVDKGHLRGFEGEHCRCSMVEVVEWI